MNRSNPKRQRGAALLALLAAIMLGASWFLVSQLNAESGAATAVRKTRNAEVMNRAKQALIGYVAAQAAKAGENNPGSLPCPENPGDFDSTTGRQGLAGTNCGLLSAQKVGRFPWRTLGTEQLFDTSGESLWYVQSRNWGVDIGARTSINSGTTGQLTLDGVPMVAIIVAPGAALSVSAAAGCTAWNQVRPTTGMPDWRNYLECENGTNPADAAFVSTGPSGSFNDQIVGITAAEVLGGIEAAIAHRIEREIVPTLRDAYLATTWGLAGMERMFPFAAAFADPSVAATSYHGAPATVEGLLPFNYGEACVPGTEPRCLLMAFSPATPPVAIRVATNGFGSIYESPPGVSSQNCNWDPTDTSAALCEGQYLEDSTSPATLAGAGMYIEMTARITNVANGWRSLEARIEARDDFIQGTWQVMTPTIVTTMNADGSATIRFGANLPNIDVMGWGTRASYRIRLKVADHRILSTRPREIAFGSGTTSEIRVGQTVVGATSGASGRVSKVAVTNLTFWESSTAPVGTTPAAGILTFYSVMGSFVSGENLRVLGVTRASSTSTESDADIDLSWFARNEWYRHVYYAIAGNYAWTGSGTCSDMPAVTCLQLANLPVVADQTKQRALLVLMGKRVSAQTRPSANLADYLDSTENLSPNRIFEQLKVGTLSNDRFITISKNP